MRICDPKASEAALLRLAYEYSLNASLRRSGWNPTGDAPAPAPELGKAGAPIYPLLQTPDAAAPRRAARPPPARADADRPDDPRPLPDRPLEGYPTVPPPPTP